MQRLAQEIYDQIAAHVESQSEPSTHELSRLAATSKAWQKAVERTNFRVLELESTDLEDFVKIVTGARRKYLRVLRYTIVLSPYHDNQRQEFERYYDREQNNEEANVAIHNLFFYLRSWEGDNETEPPASITLELSDIYSPTDHRASNPWYIMSPEEEENISGPLGMRHHYSYITPPDWEKFPVVRSIRKLVYRSPKPYVRKLAPQTFVGMATKLPCLTGIHGKFEYNEWSYPTIRQMIRGGVVYVVINSPFPDSLRHLDVCLDTWMVWNQTWKPPNLLLYDKNYDVFSSALRIATSQHKNLTSFHVRGVIDSTLLWHVNTPASVPIEPFWTNLRSLRIHFDLATPSGQWYFCARDGPGGGVPEDLGTTTAPSEAAIPPGVLIMDDMDREAALRFSLSDKAEFERDAVLFRVVPNEPVLDPLIESFARACGQIPHLDNARLETVLYEKVEVDGRTAKCKSDWGIYFAAPNIPCGWQQRVEGLDYPMEELTSPRLTLNTRGWRPSEDLMHLLRGIGDYGPRLVETHIDLWRDVYKPEQLERLTRSS